MWRGWWRVGRSSTRRGRDRGSGDQIRDEGHTHTHHMHPIIASSSSDPPMPSLTNSTALNTRTHVRAREAHTMTRERERERERDDEMMCVRYNSKDRQPDGNSCATLKLSTIPGVCLCMLWWCNTRHASSRAVKIVYDPTRASSGHEHERQHHTDATCL